MRASWRTRSAPLACLALVCLCLGGAVRASAQTAQASPAAQAPGRTQPLVVPSGPLPEPETAAQLPTAERVLAAADALRERGYEELPILAWALLETARAEGRAEAEAEAHERRERQRRRARPQDRAHASPFHAVDRLTS